jgi:hypothetical protein
VGGAGGGGNVHAPATLDIENEFIRVSFDRVSGRMVRVVNKGDGVAVDVDQNLHWYESAQAGDAEKMCGDGQQKSGGGNSDKSVP